MRELAGSWDGLFLSDRARLSLSTRGFFQIDEEWPKGVVLAPTDGYATTPRGSIVSDETRFGSPIQKEIQDGQAGTGKGTVSWFSSAPKRPGCRPCPNAGNAARCRPAAGKLTSREEAMCVLWGKKTTAVRL